LWRPIVEVQQEGELVYIHIVKFNGEVEKLFDKVLLENKFESRAVMKEGNFGWRDKNGQGYGGNIIFDEEEIRNAFIEIYKDNPNAETELVFTVNHSNNHITVLLQQGEKKIRLPKTEIKVFKSRSMTLKK
jgi:predicted SnoaL-like aldol condensation-catalyzing enzyme